VRGGLVGRTGQHRVHGHRAGSVNGSGV
jgi:hypothetical protein